MNMKASKLGRSFKHEHLCHLLPTPPSTATAFVLFYFFSFFFFFFYLATST